METPAPSLKVSQRSFRWLWFPAFALLCWWLAVRHLSSEWTLNEQYHYGWFVPLLAIYLVRIRLESPPELGAPPSRSGWLLWLLLPATALAEAVLLPIQEANPDWRLLGWVLVALAAAVTLAGFYLAGGWAWARHFLFPVLFFFTAVPWPRPIENEVMQGLMQRQAQLGAELLNWCGVMAEARGNVIALAQGVIGVDEACSGIRSLQASLMVALFVGEVFALGWARRTLFLLASAVWALALNTARTMTLASVAANGGTALVDRWHDPVGHGALAVCLAGLVALGWLLRPRAVKPPRDVRARTSPAVAPRVGASAGPALVGVVVIGGGWFGTQWWFGQHERSLGPAVTWTFEAPSSQPQFNLIKLSSRLRSELRYDMASACRWSDPQGRRWVAQYFRWAPRGDSVRTVAVHDPRACLAATGKELVRVLPPVVFSKGNVRLSFDSYWFKDVGNDVFVNNCVVEDLHRGALQNGIPMSQTMSARLEAAIAGRRNMGLRRLEIAIWNARSPEEAEALLVDLLSNQIREIP
jgi:exosortase